MTTAFMDACAAQQEAIDAQTRDDITSRAYREFNANKLQEKIMEYYQERVVTEKKELDEKIDKLSVFIKGDVYKSLPGAEQMRLNVQFQAMNGYSNVLGERIGNFPESA